MDIIKQLFILLILIVIIGSICSNKNIPKQQRLTLYNTRGETYQGYRQADGTIQAYDNNGEKFIFRDEGEELYWKDNSKEDFERAGLIAGRSITK